MKQLIAILLMLSWAMLLPAQLNGFDLNVLSDEDIVGSSRYVGLAGAMAALGGDASAVKDNPAALGVCRGSEVTFGTSFGFAPMGNVKMRIPAADLMLTFNKGLMSGVVSHTLMFSYQRKKDFCSNMSFAVNGLSSSQTDIMADLANGYTVNQLQHTDGIAYLAYAGFDAWLIDTIAGSGGRQWGSLEAGNVNAQLRLQESGSVEDYRFGWGMNISHRVYIGASVNIRTLIYEKHTVYGESFVSNNRYTLTNTFSATGVGIGANIGVIWRPLKWMRLGAALEAPTLTAVRTAHEGSISAQIGANQYEPEAYNAYYQTSLTMPFRAVAGIAFQFGTHGLLSAEYDCAYRKLSGMQPQHMVKVGAEWAIINRLFLDLGYAAQVYGRYEQTAVNVVDYGSVRLDTDQQRFGPKQYASVGLTFRNQWAVAGVAYQFSKRSTDVWAHEMQESPMGTYNDSWHKLVITLGFRFGRF